MKCPECNGTGKVKNYNKKQQERVAYVGGFGGYKTIQDAVDSFPPPIKNIIRIRQGKYRKEK